MLVPSAASYQLIRSDERNRRFRSDVLILMPVGPEIRGALIRRLTCKPDSEKLMDTPNDGDRQSNFRELREQPHRFLDDPFAQT